MAKDNCLHCAIRYAIIEFAKAHPEITMEDVMQGLVQVTAEHLAGVEIEDREIFLFQILQELPASIMEILDDDEPADVEDDGKRH